MNLEGQLRQAARLLLVLARMLLRVAAGLLIAPWVMVAVARYLARGAARVARFVVSLRHLGAAEIRCPRGHASSLHGLWECASCKGLFLGWAFQACPLCRASCGYTTCERCGLAVRNPLA